MPHLGVHCSIAGGFDRAVAESQKLACATLQIFCKNSNQWRAKPISAEEAAAFRAALAATPLTMPLIHNAYLINLGTAKEDLYRRSIDALLDEMERAALLGISQIVIHPGTPSGDESTAATANGIKRIARALDEVMDSEKTVRILLETTAGQGASIGWRFEQLAEIMSHAKNPERLAVCFDTCHVFAAGYPLTARADYEATMNEFDKIIGLNLLSAFHLNDSVKASGARVDRHAAIGEGMIGIELFRCLLNDERFENHPMYLETPKGTSPNGEDFDAINLRRLRELIS